MSINIGEINKLIELERATGRDIVFVDASGLKDTGCFRKFYWSCVKGFRIADGADVYDLKIEYGTAFHKFLELWYRGVAFDEATKAAQVYYDKILVATPWALQSEYEFRSMTHLIKSIEAYAKQYPREYDGLKAQATEQKFCFPFWKNDRITIMLCGTIDFVGTYHDIPVICDHKTTASYVTKNYFDQYELGIQTMFYSWIWNYLNKDKEKFRGAVVNGIFVKKPTDKAAKLGQFDGVKFERSRLFEYTDAQMRFFSTWMNSKMHLIQHYLSAPLENQPAFFESNYDLTFCKTPFGQCKFYNVCKSPPSAQQSILKNMFQPSTYMPLLFGGAGE